MIASLILIAIMAAAISATLIVALMPILRRYALSHPNARSSHRLPTPQGGGVAIVISVFAVCLVAGILGLSDPAPVGLVFSAMSLIALVGAGDDLWNIGIAPRLLLQTLATGLMLAALPDELRVLPMLPWWLERALLLLACLWFVNLTNFMDGIDWMTVAEFVPMSAGLAFLGWQGALPMGGVVAASALCGALIGFALFNRPVASIFLGDVGSLPIGLLVAWLLMLLAGNGHLAAALILPLYYLGDATLTLLRRIGRGEPFWQAHRTHFYQRATDRGFSVLAIDTRVFVLNIVLLAIASATVLWPSRWLDAGALAAATALVAALLYSFRSGRP